MRPLARGLTWATMIMATAVASADAGDLSTASTWYVCQAAITGSRSPPRWDEQPTYADVVKEAQRRGYTAAFCANIVDSRAAASAPPPRAPTPAAQTAPAVATAPQSDPLVASIQALLGALGYAIGGADGVLGPRTQAAIAAVQESMGERPDGRPSEALRQRLQAAVAARGNRAPPPSPSPAGAARSAPAATGSGFFIGANVVVTNHHMANGCSEIRLRKHGAEIGTARLVASNRSDDLAVLKSDVTSEHHLKLRVGVPVKPAELVLVFGYPLSSVLSSLGNTTLGNVTALTGLQDDSRYIQISASVQPGNSGGPVLDEQGRLMGVIQSKLDAIRVARATGDIPQNVNFAIRSTTLANFLETNQVAYEVASDTKPLSATELAQVAEAASLQIECRR